MSGAAKIWDGALWLVCCILYTGCISRFFGRHLKGGRRQERVFGALYFGGRLLLRRWVLEEEVPYILYAACSHMLLGALVMAVFGGEKEKRLLAAVLGLVMTELVWNFGESFLTCGALLLTRATKAGGQDAAAIGPWTGRILGLMTYGAGIWAVGWLSKALEPVFADKRRSFYLCLSAPLGCLLFVTDLVNWGASNGILVQGREIFGLFENQLFSHGAMCIFTGLSMAAAGFFVFGTERIWREEQEREQYRAQVAYYEMMEEQYGRMERLRHDMKNHMLALENLVRNRQWQHAGEYLRGMTEMGGVGAGDEATGSLVMDALLYHKRQKALKHHIRWQCDVRVPRDCPVKEIDLCIIAGNILDNALEASLGLCGEDDPFIQVYMGKIKKCLFLEARNRMEAGNEGRGGENGSGDGRSGRSQGPGNRKIDGELEPCGRETGSESESGERKIDGGLESGGRETGGELEFCGDQKVSQRQKPDDELEPGDRRKPGHESGTSGGPKPCRGQRLSRKGQEAFRRHGLGLGNIRAAADRYNGAVCVETENGIFTISVLLPLYPEAYNPDRD